MTLASQLPEPDPDAEAAADASPETAAAVVAAHVPVSEPAASVAEAPEASQLEAPTAEATAEDGAQEPEPASLLAAHASDWGAANGLGMAKAEERTGRVRVRMWREEGIVMVVLDVENW